MPPSTVVVFYVLTCTCSLVKFVIVITLIALYIPYRTLCSCLTGSDDLYAYVQIVLYHALDIHYRARVRVFKAADAKKMNFDPGGIIFDF